MPDANIDGHDLQVDFFLCSASFFLHDVSGMMASRGNDLIVGQTLTGYVQVQSERGRLVYLPLSLAQALAFDQAYRASLFQSRRPRPHRIHIARVDPEAQDRTDRKRIRTVSILVEKFGKLAVPKETGSLSLGFALK